MLPGRRALVKSVRRRACSGPQRPDRDAGRLAMISVSRCRSLPWSRRASWTNRAEGRGRYRAVGARLAG